MSLPASCSEPRTSIRGRLPAGFDRKGEGREFFVGPMLMAALKANGVRLQLETRSGSWSSGLAIRRFLAVAAEWWASGWVGHLRLNKKRVQPAAQIP
ncbi:hypothetical protein [Phyllobacterium bourgognense]|uniref:Uncharacterized protein n=1 Tax=Phyllobacterium bourgognense TaxID=314236 RepID=A0A368YGC4_9HYPH|nr:hypothetical protein [Phyllobacterium bourgognense]RCW78498.1 hypothetical protein C7476_12429 [Phyllobacterium bourgognense]